MKLIKKKLNDKLCGDAYNKVFIPAPSDSPIRKQIKKNLGVVWNDNLIWLKVRNPQWHVRNDLDETD